MVAVEMFGDAGDIWDPVSKPFSAMQPVPRGNCVNPQTFFAGPVESRMINSSAM